MSSLFTNKIVAKKIAYTALRYTPVKTGYLKDSMYIKRIGEGFKIGYSANYAIYVHEIPNAHEPPTQYKFLEDAALEEYEFANKLMGITTQIKITYDPLAIYVGVENAPGTVLCGSGVKEKRSVLQIRRILKMLGFNE